MPTKHDALRQRAHSTFHSALNSGRIVKPDTCERCGTRPTGEAILVAHHADHSKPMDVEWLCRRCHGFKNVEANIRRLFTIPEWTQMVERAKAQQTDVTMVARKLLKHWLTHGMTNDEYLRMVKAFGAEAAWPYCSRCRRIVPWTEIVEHGDGYYHERHMIREGDGYPRDSWAVCPEPVLRIRNVRTKPRDTGEHLAANGRPIDGYPRQQA